MARSNSGDKKSASPEARKTFKLKLKNPLARQYRAASNAATASSSTNAASISTLDSTSSGTASSSSSNADSTDDTVAGNSTASDITTNVAAIGAALNQANNPVNLSTRRTGKVPAPINTTNPTATYPDVNSNGDAPPSIKSETSSSGSESTLSNASPSAPAPVIPEPEPAPQQQQLSPTPPPEFYREPYRPTKMTWGDNGRPVPAGPPGYDLAQTYWITHPSRHSTGSSANDGQNTARGPPRLVPINPVSEPLPSLYPSRPAPRFNTLANLATAALSSAGLFRSAQQVGNAPAAATAPAALQTGNAPAVAIPVVASANSTLDATTGTAAAATQTSNPLQIANAATRPLLTAAAAQPQNGPQVASAAPAPRPMSIASLLNPTTAPAVLAGPSTNTVPATRLEGTTSVPPSGNPNNDGPYLDTPWQCGRRDCTSGQTWLDRDRVGRKCVSDMFGKNKNTTRAIPNGVWHWLCRKCYQHFGNDVPKQTLRYQQWKLNHARTQFLRIELWRPNATFTIKLNHTMSHRLATFHELVERHNGDRAAALAELDQGVTFKEHRKSHLPMVPAQYACPMDVAEHFQTHHQQEGASIAACRIVLDWMDMIVNTRSLANDLPIEFLMDGVGAGEVLNDPDANYAQWVAHEDNLRAAAEAAGNPLPRDTTYDRPSRAERAARTARAVTAATTNTSRPAPAPAAPASPASATSPAADAGDDVPMPDISPDNMDVQAVKGLLYLTGQYVDLPTGRIERALAAASARAALDGDIADYQHAAGVHVAAATSLGGRRRRINAPAPAPPAAAAAAGPKRKREPSPSPSSAASSPPPPPTSPDYAPSSPEAGPSSKRPRRS
nr:hypothetical protein CFP56_50941 [Quercus suber]